MLKRVILISALTLSWAMPALADESDIPDMEKVRLTLGMPVYVYHPDDRPGARGWNEGWFNNEGLLADVTWPVKKLGNNTMFRAGLTGGAFDNSIFKTSVFFGGDAEIETYVSKELSFSVGTYAGGIAGYDYDVAPAIAPYIGSAYAIGKHVELGVRGFWLPAKTIAGSALAPSDAYVGVFTVGTRF
jgi:hypothetical protein